jgi:hypothetical protein
MREIQVDEPNINLRYVYFQIFLIDGETPATGEGGSQPEIQISNSGWQTTDIGVLEDLGIGNYRALLTIDAVATVGNYIQTHYKKENTIDSFGEPILVVGNLTQIPIFESENKFGNDSIISTYVSMPEAESYFSTRLLSEEWDNAPQKNKIKSLIMATRDIDRLRFFGVKVDPNQILEFPRYRYEHVRKGSGFYWGCSSPSSSGIPNDIKIACCEIAIKHLEEVDMEAEMNTMNVDSEGFAGVTEAYNRFSVNEAKRAGINSNVAWIYLKPYLVDPYTLRVTRVS